MRVKKEFGVYDDKQFGRPWIFKIVKWPVGQESQVEWGKWIGDSRHGGEVEINAEPGEIVRYGQKDYEGSKTISEWSIVQTDGSLFSTNPLAARQHFDRQVSVKGTSEK